MLRPFSNALLSITLAASAAAPRAAVAHPPSGIAVDEKGQVYIADVRRGILRIDGEGQLVPFHQAGAHWFALDARDGFAAADLAGWSERRLAPRLDRAPLTGARGALLQTDGCPLAIHSDGNLYFARGNLEIARLSPAGEVKLIAPDLKKTADELGGIKGLAPGPGDSLYVACPSAILKVGLDGKVTAVVRPIRLQDCEAAPPGGIEAPSLRGLAAGARGTVYAAATGCRRVIQVAADGAVKVVLESERPWAPTGLAARGEELYVLEYTNGESEKAEDWLPRVRKLDAGGKVTTLATAAEAKEAAR